jgi:hypothetical protein
MSRAPALLLTSPLASLRSRRRASAASSSPRRWSGCGGSARVGRDVAAAQMHHELGGVNESERLALTKS